MKIGIIFVNQEKNQPKKKKNDWWIYSFSKDLLELNWMQETIFKWVQNNLNLNIEIILIQNRFIIWYYKFHEL
jgi:hypothetical protein